MTTLLAQPSFRLATAGTGLIAPSPVSGTGLWEKDFIVDGTWIVPGRHGNADEVLVVTPARRANWERNFRLMRARGITVPLTVDHIDIQQDPNSPAITRRALTPAMAEAKRGTVEHLFSGTGRGLAHVQPADDAAVELLRRCPEVSPEIRRNVRDSLGNVYDEAITAISLTPVPVIHGQEQEWRKIAASRATETTEGEGAILLAIPQLDDRSPKHEDLMDKTAFSPAHKKTLCSSLKLAETTSDEDLVAEVLKVLGQHNEGGEEAHRTNLSRIATLETQVQTLTTERNGLKTQADELTAKLTTAKEPLKLSRDVAGVLEEAVDTKIQTLVSQARITPDVGKKLALTLKAGGALLLSRDAIAAERSHAMNLLDILAENDAAKLAEMIKTNPGAQRIELSDPHRTADEPAEIKPERMRELLSQTASGRTMLEQCKDTLAKK